MRKNKTWSINLFGQSTTITQIPVEQVQNDEFWTNDTEAYLNFKPNHETFDFSSAELTLYNRNDQSLIVKDAEVLEGVASYEVEPDVIAHFGQWTVQVRFIQANNESFTSGIIDFKVERALGDGAPPRLTAMKSWDTFFTHAQETIDLMEEAELTRIQAELERQAQEEAREVAEAQREANEDDREANEQTRINKDRSRDDKIAQMEEAEVDRQEAELDRQAQEEARGEMFDVKEAERQAEFNARELERDRQTSLLNDATGTRLKYWAGSQAQYDAIGTYDLDTVYDIW